MYVHTISKKLTHALKDTHIQIDTLRQPQPSTRVQVQHSTCSAGRSKKSTELFMFQLIRNGFRCLRTNAK